MEGREPGARVRQAARGLPRVLGETPHVLPRGFQLRLPLLQRLPGLCEFVALQALPLLSSLERVTGRLHRGGARLEEGLARVALRDEGPSPSRELDLELFHGEAIEGAPLVGGLGEDCRQRLDKHLVESENLPNLAQTLEALLPRLAGSGCILQRLERVPLRCLEERLPPNERFQVKLGALAGGARALQRRLCGLDHLGCFLP
mmetsp:Transcript_21032/g.58753  ORF Transcript_21032/g.58753 Transcript_21032/m.58753 type:complete len:203 (+) Transcript_21032:399-1007(+)